MNPLKKKLSYFHYNIGFFDFKEEIFGGSIKINWMKHPFRDRFFADPFILDISETEIKVLVEEFPYKEWKGKISLLTIERNSYELKYKKTLLDLKTHLSFPFIFRTATEIYVIPENSASGCLHAYRFEEETQTLLYDSMLIAQPVIDPVIMHQGNDYLLFGTLRGQNENRDLYSWHSGELLKGYIPSDINPIVSDSNCGRRGGDFFNKNGELYSAAQCCVHSYGEALNLCRVKEISANELKEKIIATLYPDEMYKEGLHTFNYYKGLCVVDGLTYLYRPFEKIVTAINRK